MLGVLTQLLGLQDCDRNLMQVHSELGDLEPQRQRLLAKAVEAQAHREAARLKLMQLETERKKLELEVETKKQLISKYSLQQFQTRKNDEYRALAHEIGVCQEAIINLEDQQLALMEQADATQRIVSATAQMAHDVKKTVDIQIGHLATREQELKQLLLGLETRRVELAEAVEESSRLRYERLLKHKGSKVIVGVDRGVCGGCHMTLPAQTILTCHTDQEIVSCPNCGRILYYTPDMEPAVPADER
jgi:predicted  nucleic acid-binding Zn-ribbon protein